MGYEEAPATRLLATRCCVCHRPLVDAVSVEAGMGPDCRDKYGWGQAQANPNWDAARDIMDAHDLFSIAPPIVGSLWGENAHHVANKLVWVIATETHPKSDSARMAQVVAALGFVTLGYTLMQRLADVVVWEEHGKLMLEAPYDPDALPFLREVLGRTWNKDEKRNEFPMEAKLELWAALQRAYPGRLGMGPKGPFIIGEEAA